MPDIVTVTFNPCIDKSTSVPALIPEKKLKCSVPVFEPGGGGLNVARAIHKLGGKAIAVYPSGGYSGKFLDVLLQREKVRAVHIETKHHTRENMIVLDVATNQQYQFGMPGQELYEDEWEQCLKAIENSRSKFIVASGSLPPGVPEDIFARIARIAKMSNRKLIVDTSGEPLRLAVMETVYLIKPNLGELSALAGKEELKTYEVESVATGIIRSRKCEVVVVSLGSLGAMLVTRDFAYKVEAPIVKRKTTVGAGDCMVAGIALAISRKRTLHEALQVGVACGTAATLNPGTGLCDREDVERLLETIKTSHGKYTRERKSI